MAEAREAALPAASAAPSLGRAAAARGVASSTERALVRAAQGGSAEAMEELFRRHWPKAHRAAWLACKLSMSRVYLIVIVMTIR